MESLMEFENRVKKLETRVEKLRQQIDEDAIALVEILSNISFFGGLKMEKCMYAKAGQCGFFFLERNAKEKIPIATDCKIKRCSGKSEHCHMEISNVTCAFCPIIPDSEEKEFSV